MKAKAKPKYVADGQPYRVADKLREAGAEWRHVPPTEWEYEVWLVTVGSGMIVDSFDSSSNGHPTHLTYRECKRSIAEITADVKAGKADRWFTVPKEV